MTAPAYYLAETRSDTDGPEDPPALRLFDADQLTKFLSDNIKSFHYSWYGSELVRLFRYDSGTLTPLTVHGTGDDREHDDWLFWDFEVCAADALRADGGHVAEIAFTVRIDGRA